MPTIAFIVSVEVDSPAMIIVPTIAFYVSVEVDSPAMIISMAQIFISWIDSVVELFTRFIYSTIYQ